MRKLLFTLVLCFVASELAAAAEPAVHKMNLSESKPFALDTSHLLLLENSDLARIGEVKNMLTKDGRYIILTGNDIKAFSTSDGHFLEGYSYPSKGEWITRMWFDGDTLKAFDWTNSAIRAFDREGKLISTTSFEPKGKGRHPLCLNYFLEMPDYNGYLGFNRFTDKTTPVNPVFSLYDSTLTFVRDIPGREITSGWMSNNLAWADKHEVLYWESVCDTVFSVTTDCVRPKFVLDFGKNAVPRLFQSNPVTQDRISAFAGYAKRPELLKASFGVFFQRDAEGKLWFIFQTTDRDWHLARIDEATGRTDIYDPKIEGYKMMPFLDIADRKARMLFRKVDKDETAGIFGATSGPVAVALIDLNVLTD